MGKPPRERSSSAKRNDSKARTGQKRAASAPAKKAKTASSKARTAARTAEPKADAAPPAIPATLHAAPTSSQKQQLKGLAHDLNPVVLVGKEGVSDALVFAVHLALHAHELIKVKLPRIEKLEREEMSDSIAARAKGHIVQQLGRVLVLYRRHPEKPRLLAKKP